MSRELEQLLQECLARLDAGATPEECLAAHPEQRAELEPMLRQALMLRVAFTASPGEDFKAQARNRLMFAAGRGIRQALSAEPRPEFAVRARDRLMFAAGREARQAMSAQPRQDYVGEARQRLLRRAGANAQESLRSVPPPRLAFWVNARRRLLEAAASRTMVPAPRAMALSLRTSLSAAIVVLALAVAGLAYFTVQTPTPTVGAQLALLEEQVNQIEQKVAAGEAISPSEVRDTARLGAEVAEKVTEDNQASRAKVQIDRLQQIKDLVAPPTSDPPPALQEAQALLNQANVRIQATRVDTPASTQPPAAGATSTPPPSPTQAKPTSTATAIGPTATPVPLGPNDVRLSFLTDDNAWVEITTTNFRMLVPSAWAIGGLTFNADHIAKFESPWIVVYAPNNVTIAVNLATGQMLLSTGNSQDVLRAATGVKETALTTKELVEKTEGLAGQIYYMLQSVVHNVPSPTPTSSPSATPTATQTPSPVPSPSPSATP